jgi:hypothetical protein
MANISDVVRYIESSFQKPFAATPGLILGWGLLCVCSIKILGSPGSKINLRFYSDNNWQCSIE